MAEFFKVTFYYIIMVVLFPYSCVSNEYSCTQKTQCLCEFKNNNFLNITQIHSNFSTGNITYSFSGCNKNSTFRGCEKGKFCKYNNTAGVGILLGDDLSFKPFEEQHGAYNIVFLKTNNTITLVCTKDFNQTVFAEHQKSNNTFYIFSPYACVLSHSIPGGLSTGSVLIILFLLACLFYFVGGAIVLHCIRGARGKEMIPNIDFWQDLPSLVKDGLIFALNGCQPTAIATADSYDRI